MMACTGQPRSATPWPAACPPTDPADAKPVESADVEELAGSYAVTFVLLSHGPMASSWRGHLELTGTDTLERDYVQTIRGYVKRGFRPLAGRFRYAADTLGRREEAEVGSRGDGVPGPWRVSVAGAPLSGADAHPGGGAREGTG
jgi:hypothetical protein